MHWSVFVLTEHILVVTSNYFSGSFFKEDTSPFWFIISNFHGRASASGVVGR